MSVHPYANNTRCSTKFRGCTLQRSLDDWPTCVLTSRRASRSVSYTSSAQLDVQRHCTVCERFPACRHAVRCSDSRGCYSCLFRLRSKSHRSAHRRHAVCHLRESAEVLFTEPINHWIQEANPPFQVSLASWEPIVPSSSSDLRPHVQPIIGEPIINGAMQEVVQLSDIDQLCENETHAEKHTPVEKEHLHLRIHHDVRNPRSITTF